MIPSIESCPTITIHEHESRLSLLSMGDFEPVRKVKELILPFDKERSQILGSNAVRALKL